jgi:hypothetical protein
LTKTSTNNITGDRIVTKPATKAYGDSWERTFGEAKKKNPIDQWVVGESAASPRDEYIDSPNRL